MPFSIRRGAARMREGLRFSLMTLLAVAIAAGPGRVPMPAAEPALKPVAADAPVPTYVKDVQPLLKQYCSECHQGAKAKAGVAFETFRDERGALNQRRVWEKVLDQL